MKKNISIFMLLAPFALLAQNSEKLDAVNPIYSEILPLDNGLITYSEVVNVEGKTKTELYINANEWIVHTFNSAKDVIQFNDKEAGKIICKTLTSISFGKGWNKVILDPIYFLVTIEVKDGRYKITASNFIHHNVVVLAEIRAESDNPLEQYYKKANPSEKEHQNGIKTAQLLSEKMHSLFYNALLAMNKVEDDNW